MKRFVLVAVLFAFVPAAYSASFPRCGSGKFETRFKEVARMLKSVIGFDAGSKSLVESGKPKGKARGRYWLLNKNGVAQLRMVASIDVTRSAKACQSGKSVVLTAGGYTSTLTRKGTGVFMTYEGNRHWDNLYTPAAYK